jgi:hypothetical protein
VRRGYVDRFFGAVERLPGPAVAWFALAGLLVAALVIGLTWAANAYPIGTFNSDLLAAPILTGYFLALSAFMRQTAESAFNDFRPALGDSTHDDAELARLVSVPDRLAVLAGLVMAITTFGLFFAFLQPTTAAVPPLAEALTSVLWLANALAAGLVIAQTLLQLRAVRHLSQIARAIDILYAGPVDALSRVTAVGGMGMIIFIVLANLLVPASSTAYGGLSVGIIVLALFCFVLPLRVMHGRLSAQKSELLAASAKRIRGVLNDLHSALDAHDLSAADGINKMVTSALAERDLLMKLSTWPWTTATIRGFGSALLLPVAIFVITRGIDRFTGV